MICPQLEKSNRQREYDQYSQDVIIDVVYNYLFWGMSHRMLDSRALHLDATESKGYQAMDILHHLGLVNKHKGLFYQLSIDEGIKVLQNAGDDYCIIKQLLEIKKDSGTPLAPLFSENAVRFTIGDIDERDDVVDLFDELVGTTPSSVGGGAYLYKPKIYIPSLGVYLRIGECQDNNITAFYTLGEKNSKKYNFYLWRDCASALNAAYCGQMTYEELSNIECVIEPDEIYNIE